MLTLTSAATPARWRGEPGTQMSFTEMLPGPEQCRLGDAGGDRHVSELRLVAVDATRSRRRPEGDAGR